MCNFKEVNVKTMTKTISIKINLIADVMKFVQEAAKIEGQVIVERDIYKVDGKSLLGVMSIQLLFPQKTQKVLKIFYSHFIKKGRY